MHFGEAQEIVALAVVLVAHVAGAALLVWAMLDREHPDRSQPPWWRPSGRPPPPPAPPPTRDPLPLIHSTPSRARLREPKRIGDEYARPARRPHHAPQRTPVRRGRRA